MSAINRLAKIRRRLAKLKPERPYFDVAPQMSRRPSLKVTVGSPDEPRSSVDVWAALVWLAERGFQQASRITLTKSCRCDNSSGDGFAHRLPLAFAGSVESFTHRRNRLRFERSGLHE